MRRVQVRNNMMTYLKAIFTIVLILFIFSTTSNAISLASTTLVVVDEDGTPIEGANVYVLRDGPGGVATNGSASKGLTDSMGKHSFTMINYNGYLAYGAAKDGYYNSDYEYQFKNISFLHWQPWNAELKISLRRIKNPVPMYTRYSRIEIPELNKPIGFDLIKYDWVSPYGKGLHPDFIFTFDRNRAVNWKDFDGTLTLTFPNKHDGIQIWREKRDREKGSVFRLPYFAPLDGYEKKLVLREFRQPGDNTITRNFNFSSDDVNYLFRIRSEEANGQLIKAMYGKIRGCLKFQFVYMGGTTSNTTGLYFTYYLNPDFSHNLEFDPKRNLFEKLDAEDRIIYP